MKEGMEKQEEAIGSGLTKMSRRPGANCWRRSAKHREEAAGRGRREPAHPCAPLRTPAHTAAGPRGGLRADGRTWSSSLSRVMRWKGRMRKDLRDRRWHTGSLSSFSSTSRKLLFVLLCGRRAAVSERGRPGHMARAWGADAQGRACGIQWTRSGEGTEVARRGAMATAGGGGVRGPGRACVGAE